MLGENGDIRHIQGIIQGYSWAKFRETFTNNTYNCSLRLQRGHEKIFLLEEIQDEVQKFV